MKGVRGGSDGELMQWLLPSLHRYYHHRFRHQVHLVFPNVPIRVRSTQGVNKQKLKQIKSQVYPRCHPRTLSRQWGLGESFTELVLFSIPLS